jgi:hypothetical protein
MPREVTDQTECPLEVQIDNPVELLVRYLQHRLPDVDARRADQHVGRSHVLDGRPYALGVRHVQFQGFGLPTLRMDLPGRVLGCLRAYIRAHDAGPEGGEAVGAGLADAAAGPDNERTLAVEIEH